MKQSIITKKTIYICIGLIILLIAAIFAQDISWWTIDGGGDTCSGGSYSLSGTIGQPDSGLATMTGGSYTLTGGFWSWESRETFSEIWFLY